MPAEGEPIPRSSQPGEFITNVHKSRLLVLLIAQVVALFLVPLFGEGPSRHLWFQGSVALVIVAGLFAASSRRGALNVALILLLPAAFAWFGPDFFTGKTDDVLRLLSISVSFLFTAGVVALSLKLHDRVTGETLMGGINVYLLLIFAFALAHASIELVAPGSYTASGQALIERIETNYDGQGFATIIYFSITTLSTLGFGDIVPVGAHARLLTSAQALTGQLYLAIFIGRLVGLEVGERTSIRRAQAAARESGTEDASP